MGITAAIFLWLLVVCLAGGIVLIVVARRGRRPFPSCGRCRYDMTGSIGAVVRCPECGGAVAEVGILPPGGGPRAMAFAATGTVLLVIAVGCIGTSFASMMLARASASRARSQATQARSQAQAAATAAQQQQADSEQRAANGEGDAAAAR